MRDVINSVRSLAARYTIECELGSGGMATVFLGWDVKHKRRIAVKILKPELTVTLGAERFLREIETTANLRHPHILPLYDSGEVRGTLYYVMPYVEGESLRDRLTREKQLPIDDALQIAREVSDALSYAHSRGVIHRDINPENIMLESGHAVVTDFGVARAVREAGTESLTGAGMSLGTPAYMSPEQAAGESDVDGRTDLYSLGCVLYEMLAGRPPFTGPTIPSVIQQHMIAEPRPIATLRPGVPAPVSAALQRALAKRPGDRFDLVSQFGDSLAPPESTPVSSPALPPASSPAAIPPAVSPRPHAERVLLTITVVLAVVLALVVTFAVWQYLSR
ncbi:MAG TPA: serine/threonine-protein kinase [Gemmatimonadaceae bacterium]|nr:serine/threonine-protein kinase [Gemmatimonadaceae bacterium]